MIRVIPPFVLALMTLYAFPASFDTLVSEFTALPMEKRLTGPLFWQHGTEADQHNLDYVHIMAEGGNGHFTIESRPHTDWLGAGWYDDCKRILDEAKTLGMKGYIFDERMYPSFAVAGRVPAEHQQRTINCRDTMVTGPVAFSESGYSGTNYLFTLAVKVLNSDTVDGATALDLAADISSGVLNWTVPSGTWRIARYTFSQGYGMVDLATQADADWFVGTVVKPHYDQTGADNIAGFFYDEPEYHGTWGMGLENDLAAKGVDWKRAVLSLHHTLGNGEQSPYRYEFIETLTDRVGRVGYGTYKQYLNDRGGALIGHFDEDNWIGAVGYLDFGPWRPTTGPCGAMNLMEVQKWSDMGGLDLVCDQLHTRGRSPLMFELPRMVSSISHIYDKPGHLVMNEVFGGYGMGLPYEEMKWLGDWMTVRGVNVLVPHSFNPKYPDSDYPPYFYYSGNNPTWPWYKVWCDRQNRLSWLLSGNGPEDFHVAPVALLFCGYSKFVGAYEFPEAMEMALDNVHYDFDMLTYNVFEDSCLLLPSPDKAIALFRERYKILIVPPVEYCPCATLQKALQFLEQGGVVIGYGRVPTRSARPSNTDAQICSLTTALWGSVSPAGGTTPLNTSAAGGKAYFLSGTNEGQLTPALRSILQNCGVIPSFRVLAGDDIWINYLHRKRHGIDVFMVWNGSSRDIALRARFKAAGTPEIWEPTNGEREPALYARASVEECDILLNLKSEETRLVVFRPEAPSPSVSYATPADDLRLTGAPVRQGDDFRVEAFAGDSRNFTLFVEEGGTYFRCDTLLAGIPLSLPLVSCSVVVEPQLIDSQYRLYLDMGSAVNARVNVNHDYVPLSGVAGFAGGRIRSPKLLDITGLMKAGANRIQIQPADPGDAVVRVFKKVALSGFVPSDPPPFSFDPAGNLALNALVTAKTSVDNYGWNNAFLVDGNTSSVAGAYGYSSASHLTDTAWEWVEVDLGADFAFNYLSLFPRNDQEAVGGGSANFPVDFKVLVKADNGEWDTVLTVADQPDPAGNNVNYNLGSQRARYLRIEVTRLGKPVVGESAVLRFQLAELQLFDLGGMDAMTRNKGLEFGIEGNRPNPFNPTTVITLSLPPAADGYYVIYNTQGRIIKTFAFSSTAGRQYQLAWDSRDQRGKEVASGLYVGQVVLRDGRKAQHKMLLLK